MISNYARTQELVTAATNASGASQEQYEKTLESLQSKLNQLADAWKEFTMSIANSDIIKGAIDLLTGLINSINKLTSILPGAGSGFAKLGIAVGGLKIGGKVFDGFVTSFQQLRKAGIDPVTAAIKGFGVANKTTFTDLLIGIRDIGKGIQLPMEQLQRSLLLVNDSGATFSDAMDIMGISINTTADQMRLYNELIDAGYDKTLAQVVITNSEVAAKISQTKAGQDLNDELIKENINKELNNNTTKKGLLFQLAETVQKIANKRATDKGTESHLAAWFAKKLETGATWDLVAAEAAAVAIALGAVAVIAVLVAGIIALVKAFKNNTPEARMQKLADATKRAEEEAQKAKDTYDDLLESSSKYSELNTELSNLVIGTQEWRDKLFEVNQQVLDLIDKYPQLAQYLETGEAGQLTISEAGWEETLKRQQQAALTGQILQAEALQDQRKQETINLAQELGDILKIASKSAGQGWGYRIFDEVGRDTGAISYNYLKLFDEQIYTNSQLFEDLNASVEKFGSAAVFAKDETGKFSKELITLSQRYGADIELLYDSKDALRQYRTALEQTTTAAQQMSKSLLTSAATEDNASYKYLDQITDAFANMLSDNENEFKTKITDEMDDVLTDSGKSLQDSDVIKEYASDLGLVLAGTDKDNLKKMYAAVKGLDYASIDFSQLDEDQMKTAIINAYSAEKIGERMNTMIDSLELLSDNQQQQIAALLSSSPEKMTRKQIQAMSGTTTEKIAQSLGYTKKGFAEQFGIKAKDWSDLTAIEKEAALALGKIANQQLTAEEMLDVQQKANEIINEQAYKNATARLQRAGFNVSEVPFSDRISPEAAKGLADQLITILQNSSAAEAQKIAKELNTILSDASLDDSDITKIITLVNSMDFKDLDAWNSFENILRDMGVEISSNLSKKIQLFTSDASVAASAISKVDVSKLQEAVQPIQKIIGELMSGSQERVFDEATYKTIVAANKDLANDFQQTLSGDYVYVGGALNNLRKALEDNTNALLMNAAGQASAKIRAGNIINSLISGYNPRSDIGILGSLLTSDLTTANASKKREALAKIQTSLIASGVDISLLDIEGFSNKSRITDTSKFTDNDIQRILNDLAAITADVDGIENDYENEIVASKAIQYQALPAAMNAQVASRLAQQISAGKYTDEDALEMLARVRAIGVQAATAGVSSKMLSEYSVAVNDLNDAITRGETDLTKYIEKVASLSTSIGTVAELETANAKWRTHLETMSELVDTYNKLQDEGARLSIAKRMADAFGIEATDKNYKAIAKFIEEYINGSYEAYEQLMSMVTNGTSKISEEMYDLLSAYGLVIAELDKDTGEIYYRLRTATELGGIIELADTKWTNPYDWMYEMNKRTNALIRERERLEKQYQRVLNNSNASAQELTNLTQAQFDIEMQRAQAAEERINKAREEAASLIAQSGYAEFIKWDEATGLVMPAGNYEGLGQKFEDVITKLEELGTEIEEAQDDLDEINDNVAEIQDRGKQEYLELEEAIKDALVSQYEKEIEKLEQIDSTIADSNAALLESVQRNLSQLRQDRQNERTEADIAAKQTRLAYLQMDTSGANASEILSLQKEIAEAQEQYTDELIDQEIQRLEDANQIAQDQRQQQIELLRQQLDNAIDNGELWDTVHELIAEGIGPGGINFDSDMIKLLQDSNAWGSMSKTAQDNWLNQMKTTAAAALDWFNRENSSAESNNEEQKPNHTPSIFSGDVPAGTTITLSEPEIMNLKNTLAGDNYFDIDIIAESLGNDYDVEQMAGTIKRLIVDDAVYRNNVAVERTI